MKNNEYLIYKLSDMMKRCTKIDAELFRKMDVKRGLRNEELNFEGRQIIRPAYRCVTEEREYISIDRR